MEKNWKRVLNFVLESLKLAETVWRNIEKNWKGASLHFVLESLKLAETVGRNTEKNWKREICILCFEPHTGRNSLQKHGEELKEREFAFCAWISHWQKWFEETWRRTERLRVPDHDMVVDSSSRGIGFSHRFWEILESGEFLSKLSFKLELYRLIVMVGKLAGFCKMMSLINWCWWWESLQGFIRWWAW